MKTVKILQILQRAKAAATMERASFNDICTYYKSVPKLKDGRDVTEGEVTNFIRERTRLYRETWIIAALEDAITLIEAGR